MKYYAEYIKNRQFYQTSNTKLLGYRFWWSRRRKKKRRRMRKSRRRSRRRRRKRRRKRKKIDIVTVFE